MNFLYLFAFLCWLNEPSLRLRFVGNEAFEITDGHTTILTDYPYRSGAFGYMTYNSNSVQPSGNVILLISHRHADHFDSTLAQRMLGRIVGPPEVTRSVMDSDHSTANNQDCSCAEEICALSRIIKLDSVITIGNIRIYPIATPHGDIEHYSYRVEWGGVRLFFSGDTDDPSALFRETDIGYAFITPWLWKTVKSRRASLNARKIIIYHHRKDEQIESCSSCWIPVQGDRRELQ